MAAVLLDSLVPIFAVIGLGYFAGWIRDIDNTHVTELNALAVDFALPAAMFIATATTPRALIVSLWPMLLVFAVVMLGLYALSYWIQRSFFGLGPGVASVQALTVAQPNYAAAGLPLIAAVFHNMHAVYVALALCVGTIVTTPLTLAFLEASKLEEPNAFRLDTLVKGIGRAFLKPIVLAPILGICFSLLAIPLPGFVRESFTLIGQGAGGVAAFITGLILSSQPIFLDSNVVSGTLLKNVAQPLAAAGLVMLLPIQPDEARATILLVALPAGFFGVLFGLRYEIETRQAGSTLIVSSIFSAVTLGVALALSYR
jgi:malonate transporter and related proteins